MPEKAPSPPADLKARNRAKPWDCVTTNFALPGFGSLLARRAVGYIQAPLCVLAFALTMIFGALFVLWYFQNRERISNPSGDPLATLQELWINVRWALAGMGLFAVDWLWALGTSLSVLSRAKNEAAAAAETAAPAKTTLSS